MQSWYAGDDDHAETTLPRFLYLLSVGQRADGQVSAHFLMLAAIEAAALL